MIDITDFDESNNNFISCNKNW